MAELEAKMREAEQAREAERKARAAERQAQTWYRLRRSAAAERSNAIDSTYSVEEWRDWLDEQQGTPEQWHTIDPRYC